MAEVYPHPKMNAAQWIENFWYHYRWQFLFGLVVFVFLLIATVQLFVRKEPDASFLYVGPAALSDETCRAITSSASEKLTEDYNGDRQRKTEIRAIQLTTEADDVLSPHQKNEADKLFQNYKEEILSGEDCFLLLSPEFYDALDQAGSLMSVYEIFGAWRGEDDFLCGIYLRDTALADLPGFKDLPRDTILCLKYAGGYKSELSDKETDQLDERNRKIFRDLCA